MSSVIQSNAIESALVQGDLSKLNADQRLSYYKNVCESLGLNPLTKPFEYITLNGKLTLYAKRDATDQLRKVHGVSITISSREKHDDIYVVTARAKDKTGREDESTGAVSIAGLKGDALANAFMKAETKAKRRVTMSVCGLGMLDETEVVLIEEAKTIVKPFFEEKIELEQLSHDPGIFQFTFGKYKGLTLKEIQANELDNYLEFLRKSGSTNSQVLDAIEFAEAYLKTREFAR